MPTPATVVDQHVRRRRQAAVRNAVELCLDRASVRGDVPPVVYRLAQSVPRHVFAEVGLLAWLACRWGELSTIDVSDVQEDGRIWIWQSKVAEWSSTRRLPSEVVQRWAQVHPETEIPAQSRKTVSRWIRRTLRERGLGYPRGVQSGTHLIRHLTASGLAWQGEDPAAISERLRHSNAETTAEYIHTKADWQPA